MSQWNAKHALNSMIELRQAMQSEDELTSKQQGLLHACGSSVEAVTECIEQLQTDLEQKGNPNHESQGR